MMTILVLSILAATVIISLSNTNIISETSKTVLKSDLAAMQDMATVYFADNYNSIDMEKEYLITEFGITDDEFKDYRDCAFVKAGKVYIKPNAPEDIQEVAKELNMLIDGTSSSTGEVVVEKTIKTLRIYGSTESTESTGSTGSVGEKTLNMIDYKKISDTTSSGVAFTNNNDGTYTANGNLTAVLSDLYFTKGIDFTDIKQGVEYYASSGNDLNAADRRYYLFAIIKNISTGSVRYFSSYSGTRTFTLSDEEEVTSLELRIYAPTGELFSVENEVFKPILCKASEYIEYEPYGYKIPVRVTGSGMADKTYNIYLTEPLRKIGSVADYIDCTTCEVVRYIGVNDAGELEVLSAPVKESVTLEEMNFEGVNHIFVDTTVTPSNIEVKY